MPSPVCTCLRGYSNCPLLTIFGSFDATVRTIVDDIGKSLGFSRCWLLHLPRAHDGNALVNESGRYRSHNDIPATDTRSHIVPRRIDVSTERERVQRLVDEVARHCRSSGQPGLLYKKTSIADDDLVPWQSLLDRHADSAHLVPLRVASEKFDEPFDCVGVLIIEALSEPDLEILVTLANHLALLFDNHELNAQLKLLSELDPMTSLMTRRRFHAELTHEFERARFFRRLFLISLCRHRSLEEDQ
jgi:GAF domain-containing protein